MNILHGPSNVSIIASYKSVKNVNEEEPMTRRVRSHVPFSHDLLTGQIRLTLHLFEIFPLRNDFSEYSQVERDFMISSVNDRSRSTRATKTWQQVFAKYLST